MGWAVWAQCGWPKILPAQSPGGAQIFNSTQDTIQKDFFLSEARTLVSLNHPQITLIYDAVFDAQQGMFYLVMEYVEEKSLASLLEQW
ncbi:MAG: protein kinase [Anaerolineae bacterium]